MKYYVIIFLYLAVSILLFNLNWELFTTYLNVDFGFGTFSTLPFLVLQVINGLILAGYMAWDRMTDLKREILISSLNKEILELQKDAEITKLKTVKSKVKNDISALESKKNNG
ncbi:MAG: hypothetical protein CSA39_01655 [Flavobacteriales bacterium]|nr:MAG: hypothetical protein CSA39_01655 [Flavobacteriales bacterium]